ncbi:MAG: hypothetical protein ACREYF_04430 [Gammaproteobacteria bacterium]
MPRPSKLAYDLSDAEKRDLIEIEVPTNADKYMGLRDALGTLADSPRFTVSSSPLP